MRLNGWCGLLAGVGVSSAWARMLIGTSAARKAKRAFMLTIGRQTYGSCLKQTANRLSVCLQGCTAWNSSSTTNGQAPRYAGRGAAAGDATEAAGRTTARAKYRGVDKAGLIGYT